ncbi:MAG: methyltransferase domain-containing protein [Bryobacterales bacterium]|nr:class I SAM-dependent methyltransferase [Bryobacteraceae bacterium]MDW8354285.1 methyltransferase domain-containing protein [Bryobacterales bacterium]
MGWRQRFFRKIPPPLALTPELERRIRRCFDEAAEDEEHFPSEIDPRILHVRLILEQLGDLDGKRVLDAGCGKGRFARILKQRYPGAEVWGLDLSERMLGRVPPGVVRCAGTLTALPFASATFDGAFAVESLEHAVAVESAVSELCRVVKPGGAIVVIDKNVEHWGRLKTPEWERWFDRRQLERLLRRHCREVSSRPISYWEDVPPDGLFIAWTARK